MKKVLKCSYCHKNGHDSLHCYKKMWDKRLGRGKYKDMGKKHPLEANRSRSKGGLDGNGKVIPKRTKMSKGETYERRKLIRELDRVTSLVVRLGSADKEGYIICYTCGKRLHWKQAHCCHLWKRRRMQTRWELDNLEAGCPHCNVVLNGNYEVYMPKKREELGEDRYWELYRKAHSSGKVTTIEMREQLKEMNAKLADILKQRKNQ